MKEFTLQGVPAAEGLAEGPAFFWRQAAPEIPRTPAADPAAERARLSQALKQASQQLAALGRDLASKTSTSDAGVLAAQELFLSDPALLAKADEAIRGGANAAAAWFDATEHFARQLEQLPDKTLSARSVDVRDIGQRVVKVLLGNIASVGPSLKYPVVLLAQDLTPSQTAGLDSRKVLAICTSAGGPTSHTAILARALGIPAVVGLGSSLETIVDETPLLVDGTQGSLVGSPNPELLKSFQHKLSIAQTEKELELLASHSPGSENAPKVEVFANIGSAADARRAVEFGAEGIGLLRTEFLFLNRTSAPSHQDQLQAYGEIFEAVADLPIIVRTLDAGADKELGYLAQGNPANPALARRGIRQSLADPAMFEVQLRALLEAGQGHDLRIMFPMIATREELDQALAIFERLRSGTPSTERVQVGMMIEVPSAVWLAEELAPLVDFFSIGTNDLTQYSFAADRTDPQVANLNQDLHPVILRQIDRVVKAAHANETAVGVCGELAGRREAIPVLGGLGVDELSMAPAAIPAAKGLLRRLELAAARDLASACLALGTAADVLAASKRFLEEIRAGK